MVTYKFKILLLGDPSVGKTSLIHQFVDGEFKEDYSATIGAQFLVKEVNFSLEKDKADSALLNLWDIGGQPRFIDLRTTFYRGTAGALLIFDLTSEKTFEDINTWHNEMNNVLQEDIPFVLIGNKADLTDQRKVTPSKAKTLAKSKDSIYMETSAKTGKNVEDAFVELTKYIISKKETKKPTKKPPKKALKEKIEGSYIVKSKVREYIKSKGCNTSSALLDGSTINTIISQILDKAIARTKANGRKTVQPKDI